MLALVTTPRFLLLVDLTSGFVEPIENHRPEYYGVSWFPGTDELVLSHTGLNSDKLVDIQSYALSEVGYLSNGTRHTPPFLSAPHQILCSTDGRVIVTNTGRNRIQVLSLDKPDTIQEAGISASRWDRLSLTELTGDHLNSVFRTGDKLYVIAHRHFAGSKLVTFSYPELRLLAADSVTNATGLHNVFLTQESHVISCHSSAGGLLDLTSKEMIWEAGSPVYTRGLAATDEHYFVGESAIASREERIWSLSGLWIVNRRTLKAEEYFSLGPYGGVHEVRLVDVPDLAHHGVPLSVNSAGLRARLRDSVRKERLSAEKAFQAHAQVWRGFTQVFGTPAIDSEGWKTAQASLCLAVSRQPVDTLTVSYRLSPGESQSHVSLVAGYAGHGDDRHMDAFMLQSFDHVTSTLSHWVNNGTEWVADSSFAVPSLPLTGELTLRLSGSLCEILVNGKTIATRAVLACASRPHSLLGIRWIGSSVRPVNLG